MSNMGRIITHECNVTDIVQNMEVLRLSLVDFWLLSFRTASC